MANMMLLERTLEHIQDNPSRWMQMSWYDCFAGHACRLADEPALWERGEGLRANEFDDPKDVARCLCCPDRVTVTVMARAMRLLDLSREEVGYLFHGGRTLPEIERFITAMLMKSTVRASWQPVQQEDRALVSA